MLRDYPRILKVLLSICGDNLIYYRKMENL